MFCQEYISIFSVYIADEKALRSWSKSEGWIFCDNLKTLVAEKGSR